MLSPFVQDVDLTLYNGDALTVLRELSPESVNCVVTSPPYLGLRDYGHDRQIGLEPTIGEYVETLVRVFSELRRVLRADGTFWLNLGDSYNAYNGGAGPGSTLSKTQTAARPRLTSGFGLQQKELKPKDLMMIPARVAIALCDDGWYLRSEIVWAKPNPMPESVTDRPTSATERVYLLAKQARYYYDADAIREDAKWERWGKQNPGEWANAVPSKAGMVQARTKAELHLHWKGEGRNVRNWWPIPTESYDGAHFATYPQELVRLCILAGCPEGGTVLDPFFGSGTTGLVARRHGRCTVGIELNPEYCRMAAERLQQLSLLA